MAIETVTVAKSALLKQLAKPHNGDPERLHANAEYLLMEYLRAIGADDIAEAWNDAREAQEWWYA